MNTKDFELLEKMFEAEMQQLLPYQCRETKQVKRLLEDQMIEPMTGKIKSNDRFPPMEVSGYCLTLRGNILYCEECDKRVKDEDV